MKVQLNLGERYRLLDMLPKEGNITTIKTLRILQDALCPSEDEVVKWEIKENEGRVTWNPELSKAVEVSFGPVAHQIAREVLLGLDKDNKLTLDMISLYEKLVEVEEEK